MNIPCTCKYQGDPAYCHAHPNDKARIKELESDLADADRVNELVKARHAELEAENAKLKECLFQMQNAAIDLAAKLGALEKELEAKCTQLQDEIRDHTCTGLALSALEREIAEAPVVYGQDLGGILGIEWHPGEEQHEDHTHRARLVRIEPIKEKP